jgi:ubiquinone biosynthesis protein
MVLARFGPRLPGLVEAALLRQSNPQPEVRNGRLGWMVLSALGGAALASGAIALMVALT